MSGKSIKLNKKAVRKEANLIRKATMDGFFEWTATQGLFTRVKIAARVLFKRGMKPTHVKDK